MSFSLSERPALPAGAAVAIAVVALLGLGCRANQPVPDLTVSSHQEAGRTTFTLRPAPGVRINARVEPAIEFTDGSVLRLASSSLSADSAYFTAPPTGSVPTASRHSGIVRASICREDEAVCRPVQVPLGEP